MNEERDVNKTIPAKEFIAELRRLADTLEAGRSFEIEIEGEKVVIPMEAVCSVEHERSEDGEEEIEFQLTWNASANEASGNDDDQCEDDVEEEADENKEPAKSA